jgi:DNA-binding SARP family transcriptional activator
MGKRGTRILDIASAACIHEYMECAIFSGLKIEERRLLCSLALIQPFDEALVKELFADATEQVQDILSSLSFFFEAQTEKGGGHSRQFAHLYADFFVNQAAVVLEPEQVRKIHKQAACYFRSSGNIDRALSHLISLEEWHEAIALLQSCANQWFEGEDYSLLPYWVEQLPKDILVDYPQLAVSLGQAHLYLGDVDKAGQAYALAHQQSRIGSKIWLESGCLLCEVLLLQGNKEECVELASELVDHAGLISPFRVRALMFQAIGLHLLCRFEECERIWKKIETIARSRFIPLTRTARCYLMGPKAVFHNLERGEFEESGQILDEAITVFRSSDPMKRLGWMLLFKGILKLEMHCYPEALAWFREAEAVSGRTNRSVHAASIAFLAFGLVMMGQKDEAKHWLDRAAPLASRDLSLWAPIICSLARAQLKEEGEDVVAELQLAWNLACQRQMILPMSMTAYIAFAMHESGGDDLAIQFCRQAANRCRQWNVIHREAQLLFYLYILEQERNPVQARQDFKRAMVLISEHNLGFLLIRDKRMDGLSLTLLAIKLNIETSFFLKLSSSWGKKAFEGLIPIFQQATLDVKTRIASIWARHGYQPALEYIELAMRVVRGKKTIARLDSMKQRLQACPPEPLHVNLFGPFTLVRGEEEIPEQAWKRHKARDLFKFLCLHPDRVFTREQLTEIFWPESSPEKAKANLWSAVSTIRAAIEPELSARAKSSYLHCTSQTYSLRLPDDSTIDTVVFENRVKDGLHYLNSGDTARALLCFESAVSLYPDELLPEDRYAPWSTEIREHYERLFTSTLRKMADLYLEKRDFEATIKIYRQIIALDSWDEDSYLELMRCYVLQGQDLKAVEVYRLCEEVLSRELGVTPAPRLRDFLDRILQRRESGFKSAVGLGGVPN